MTSIRVFAQHRPFEPEAAEAMGAAFDAAWQSLIVQKSELTSAGRREATREQLALRIIDAARNGERAVDRLRDDALEYVLNSNRASVNDAVRPRGRTRRSGQRPPA